MTGEPSLDLPVRNGGPYWLRLIDALTAPPHKLVTVGPKSARAARAIALTAKLRGPDALYVWLASREGIPLCTLDREIVSRAGAHCRLMAP